MAKTSKTAKKWRKVSDKNVRAIWRCPECGKREVVEANYYAESGEPVCTRCDTDMEYVKTEIFS